MSEIVADLPSNEVLPENIIGRTVTVARKMQVYNTELVRTHSGSLTGQWTDTEGWTPSEDLMAALRSVVNAFTTDGPDVLNLKWEREAS